MGFCGEKWPKSFSSDENLQENFPKMGDQIRGAHARSVYCGEVETYSLARAPELDS